MKSEVQAQCDSTWTHVIDTVTVDGCQYEVDLCILCRYAYPGEVKINSYKNIDSCSTVLNPAEIGQGVIVQLSTWGTLFFDNCQQGGLPPCDVGSREFNYSIPICWQATLLVHDPSNSDNNIYMYEPCEGAICEVTYSFCMGPMGHEKTVITSSLKNGPITCTTEGHDIELPTGYVGEYSECYFLHTPCNP